MSKKKTYINIYDSSIDKVVLLIMNYIFFIFTFLVLFVSIIMSNLLEEDIIDSSYFGYMMIFCFFSVFFPFYNNASLFVNHDFLVIKKKKKRAIKISHKSIKKIVFKNYFSENQINTFDSIEGTIVLSNNREHRFYIQRRFFWGAKRQFHKLKLRLNKVNVICESEV